MTDRPLAERERQITTALPAPSNALQPELVSVPEETASSASHETSPPLASVLVPGLGQMMQGRYFAGAVQFVTVVAYIGGTTSLGMGRAAFLAFFWNVWSVADAWWWERRNS
jgi:hypothetical protein